jgi:hypothetical protein
LLLSLEGYNLDLRDCCGCGVLVESQVASWPKETLRDLNTNHRLLFSSFFPYRLFSQSALVLLVTLVPLAIAVTRFWEFTIVQCLALSKHLIVT